MYIDPYGNSEASRRRQVMRRLATVCLGVLLGWILIACGAGILISCGALAQPAPDDGPTRPVPEAKALRDAAEGAAGFMESLATQQRWQEETISRLEVENTRLQAAAMELWTPGTVLKAGGRYRFPADATPANIVVGVDDVWLLEPNVYPANGNPAIDIRPEAHRTYVLHARIDAPAGVDTSKLGPGIQDRGKDSRVIDPVYGRCNQAVRATVGSDGLVVAGLKSGLDVRANVFYADGATRATFTHGVALGSIGEIPVRVSPFSGSFSSRVVVANSEIHNDAGPDEKGVLDFRQGQDLAVVFTSLWSTPNRAGESGTAASAGPPVDGDHPPIPGQEARNVYFVGVETHKGKFEFRNSVKYGRVIDARLFELNAATDPMVYITGRYVQNGTPLLYCDQVLVRGLRGQTASGRSTKPPVAGRFLELIDGFDQFDNLWLPPPATQPTTRPIQ
jgi:hypothetical protein